MVVSSVHILPNKSDSSGPQMIDTYAAQLEALGAKKCGTFSVECDTYYPNQAITTSPQKVLNLIISSEYPASAFSLIENGPSIVADASFELILSNLSSFYSSKKLAHMEVRGQKWSLNDFTVKMGSCTMGPSFKEVVAEIEYGPCSVPSSCWDLIKELGQTFVGASIGQPHQHLLSRMNEFYTPIDTINQYNDIFNHIKKSTLLIK